MKRKDAPFPYEEYYFYQPSFSTKEGRYVINLFHKLDKTHTTISNARFVYETYHQIKLLKNQFVDHKDSNKSNDSIDNLQVLTRQENHNKSLIEYNVKKTFVELCCPNCNNIFVRQKRVTFLCKRNGKFTACSRHCAGIIRQKFQMGESIDLSKNFIRYIIEPAKTGVTS
jgi:hypothetical protein